MPTINSINLNGISYALEGGGGNSQDIEDIKRLIYPSITTVCEEGEPITFTKGNRVITVTPTESGTYTQYIPELGTWTVEMESGGVEFSRDVEVENVGDGYSVVYPSITAEGEEGVPISFTKGELVIEKTPDESGVVTQYLPELGTWTVETEYKNQIFNKNINASVYDQQTTCKLSLEKSFYTPFSTPILGSAITSFDKYVIMGGGATIRDSYQSTDPGSKKVIAYNIDTGYKYTPTDLTQSQWDLSAVKIGESYALFGNGTYWYSRGYTYTSPRLDAYDTSLVKTSVTQLSYSNYYKYIAVNFNDIAFFRYTHGVNIETYSSSLVKTASNSSYSQYNFDNKSSGYASNNNYLLIGGGSYYKDSTGDIVLAYNTSLVESLAPVLSRKKNNPTAVAVENFILFGGGSVQEFYENSSDYYITSSNTVEAYNQNLIKTTIANLSYNNYDRLATELVCGAVFFTNGSKIYIDIYNSNLVKSSFQENKTTEDVYFSSYYPCTVTNDKNKINSFYINASSTTNKIVKHTFGYTFDSKNILDNKYKNDLGKSLIPKTTESASVDDDIFIGTDSNSPTISSNYIIRKSGIIDDEDSIYIFIKKSLFNFDKYEDEKSATNALNYINIIAHSASNEQNIPYYFTTGSNHTSTHYQFVLTNVASPFRIYLQN